MKAFRELIKNYSRKILKGSIMALITFAASCVLFGIMALPGVAIAYIVGYTNLKEAAAMSFLAVSLMASIATGLCKICKDYQKLKRKYGEQ